MCAVIVTSQPSPPPASRSMGTATTQQTSIRPELPSWVGARCGGATFAPLGNPRNGREWTPAAPPRNPTPGTTDPQAPVTVRPDPVRGRTVAGCRGNRPRSPRRAADTRPRARRPRRPRRAPLAGHPAYPPAPATHRHAQVLCCACCAQNHAHSTAAHVRAKRCARFSRALRRPPHTRRRHVL